MSVLRNILLSSAVLVMTVSPAMAGEKSPLKGTSTVIAKLLILPGDNSPTGLSDIDSPARDVSLGGAFTEGSSSHNGQNDQNNATDILDDTELGKSTLNIAKAHKPVKVKRNASSAKKNRVKVVRLSIPRQTVKRRAPLMLGVYR